MAQTILNLLHWGLCVHFIISQKGRKEKDYHEKNKYFSWGGLLLASLLIGCSSENPLSSTVINQSNENSSSLKDEDLKMDGHLYIHVSAENHPYTMPFAGLVGVWLVDVPSVNPPKRNPDNIHYWDADDSNPTYVLELVRMDNGSSG